MAATSEHGMVKQYLLEYGEEQIPVVPSNIVVHDWQNKVMMLEMNRFIVGRPNPIRLPIVPEGVELSDAMNSGYYFEQKVW